MTRRSNDVSRVVLMAPGECVALVGWIQADFDWYFAVLHVNRGNQFRGFSISNRLMAPNSLFWAKASILDWLLRTKRKIAAKEKAKAIAKAAAASLMTV
ncbi:hypothetical protein CTATCC11996_11363 [Comamonas testosteroni ATCC 11996]|nr:hypothetical protein CTATCC11996_11363 [Comamonas testosteroni ATCC 11996]